MMEPCQLYTDLCQDPYYSEQFDKVLDDKNNYGISAEVDHTTLICGGNTYELLAKIIPENRVVYDFGAAYGLQAYYFRNHQQYIAIQPPYNLPFMPFRTENSFWFFGTIQEFFEKFEVEDNSFAICNYVPDRKAVELVRQHCPHCFTNYPTSEDCQAFFDPPLVGGSFGLSVKC